jgi:putative membrane protein
MLWNRQRHSTWKGLVAGAIGGAVASFAMNQFQAGMSKLFKEPAAPPERKPPEAKQRRQTSEESANVKAAVAVSETVFNHQLAPKEKQWAGQLVHYGYGTAAGALYGAAAEHWEDVRIGQGAAFGAALWAISDEVAVPVFHLSKGPQEYPLRTHAMALASHLVYSVTTELARRLLRSGVLSK